MNLFQRIIRRLGSDKALNFVYQSTDLLLAFFIVTLILIIIIPIPTFIIDQLIAVNLMVSITLLMVSLYITKATHISVFPSLLLITTLFRLGIEISATRQILLTADAGHIINAIGSFVVGGNFIIGIVIFLIITIVQFIVVTKGAERVAEVAARFTLDAMPGKQMSIDADMRSGLLDANQARELRLALNKESQLYGAMDGAMKFVKGDVIASIVIAIINIVGGLIIGVTLHNMSAFQAAQTYTLLSIGSGLITQIPSLLISMTSGIVITRVSSDKKDAHLGREIAGQILGQPKAIILAASVLMLLGTVPQLPSLLFLTMGGLLGGVGFFTWRGNAQKESKTGISSATKIEKDAAGNSIVGGGVEEYTTTPPVVLEVGAYLSGLMRKDKLSTNFLESMIPRMRNVLYQELGILFPGVHIRVDSLTLGENEYIIYLHEVPITRGTVVPKYLLTIESEETLQAYGLAYQRASTLNRESLWVEQEGEEILKKGHCKFWNPMEVLILHLTQFYRQNAGEFLGIQEIRGILTFLDKSAPDLVKEVSRLIPLQKLTEIFKRLVQEGISIKDLRTVFEALIEWGQTEKDTILLTEYVRGALKRYISYKYSEGEPTLAAYTLDTEIEDMVRSAIKQTSAGAYLALDPDAIGVILNAFHTTITPTPLNAQKPVLLSTLDVRRFVRKLIETDYPELPVLSYQEIVPEMKIQPLGRVALS